MMLGWNTAGLKNGVAVQLAPFTPFETATTASTTNSASTISSATRNSLLVSAVVSMPRRLTTVLITTNAITQTACGTSGSTEFSAAAPVT